jgi:hypothetical protein
LIVYPNPDSWNEFYPSEIFVALEQRETQSSAVSVFVKAKIGATIVVGTAATSSTTYKKVREIADLDDIETGLVVLSRVGINS